MNFQFLQAISPTNRWNPLNVKLYTTVVEGVENMCLASNQVYQQLSGIGILILVQVDFYLGKYSSHKFINYSTKSIQTYIIINFITMTTSSNHITKNSHASIAKETTVFAKDTIAHPVKVKKMVSFQNHTLIDLF